MSFCLACGEKMFGDMVIHPRCCRNVFETQAMPRLALHPGDFPPQPILQGKNPSLSVLQPVIHLRRQPRERRLIRDGRPGPFVLKIPLRMIKYLTQNQNLCMTIADRLNIPAPPHTLIPLEDDFQGYFALLLRTDYHPGASNKPHRKSLRLILAKPGIHNASLEETGDKIRHIAHIPGLAVQYFLETVIFSFLIGHGDLHLDKICVLYDQRKKNVRFAPVQDFICTKLIRPDEPDFCLSVNGKTHDLSGDDFKHLAQYLQIPPKAYSKMILRFFSGKRAILRAIHHSFLELDQQLAFTDLINDRFKRLMT